MRDQMQKMGYPEWVAAVLQGKFHLTPSFGDGYVHLWQYRVTVMRGRKYHRIVIQSSLNDEPNWEREQRMAHCFVDDDGNVYMSAGWTGPNKAVRYNVSTEQGVKDFMLNADPYGGYLYAGRKVEAA